VTRISVVRVERLARDLIAAFGLSATLVKVRYERDRWHVAIRIDDDRAVELDVADTLVVAELRAALENQLLTRI